MVVVAGAGAKGAGAGVGAALLLMLLLYLDSALGDQCIIPAPHAFFINDLGEMNDRICHRCYQAPPMHQLSIRVHKVRLFGLSSIMIYVDGAQRPISQDCGLCSDAATHNVTESGDGELECQECEQIPNGALLEMYLRLDAKTEIPNGDTACQKIADFNISVAVATEKPETEASSACDNGLMVSLPVGGDTCLVNSTAMTLETHCLIPTCSDGIIATDQLTEKVEYVFQPLAPSESCVWQLNTAGNKHLTLRFSRGIRPHLIIYEESLMNPKWDIEWCPAYSDVFRRDTDADTVFVVYYNPSKLAKQGSLSITTQPDLCLLPPLLEDGSVEFQREDGSTVAHYRCSPGHTLLGPPSLTCTQGTWHDPPACIPDKPIAEDDEPGSDDEELVEEEADVVEETEGEEIEEREVWEERESERPHPNATMIDLASDIDGNSTADNSTEMIGEDTGAGMLAVLLKKLDLEEDMAIYVIGGGACLLLFLVVVLVVAVAMCRRNYPGRLALGRRFDTFQNPIYEKAVVRMPMQTEGEREGEPTHTEEEEEEERKKSDAEEMSDCTVLE